MDVAYVGSLTRHLDSPQSAFNAVPPGAEFLPQNQDPTNPGLPLPDDFFRPYRGYSGLTVQQFVNSNYNAFQLSAVHRFSKNLDISANYAWSKSLGHYPHFATYHDNKLQYGVLPFDRTHVLRFYYVYNLPKVSTKWNMRSPLGIGRLAAPGDFAVPERVSPELKLPVYIPGQPIVFLTPA